MAYSLTSKQRNLLNKVYYKDKVLMGRDKLFAYLNLYYPDSGISRRQVMDWLKKQNVHQLFSRTMKTKDIQGTVLKRPYVQIGIDLADMQNYEYKGYNYILTAIDLFSKKLWAKPLKGKKTSIVTKAMREIFNEINHPIVSIRSDNGSEFISKTFKNLLKRKNVKQVLGLAGKPQSNGQIENMNGTLKRLLKKNITLTDDQNWPKVLQTIVRNINNVPNTTTKKTPNDVAFLRDEDKIQEVKESIKKTIRPQNEAIGNNQVIHNVGDKVRIKLIRKTNYKLHNTWSRDVFQIYRVFKPRKPYSKPYYYVKDEENEYRDRLYNNDVQVITEVQRKVKAPKKFEISKILDSRMDGAAKMYLVRWKNEKVATWEAESNLKRDIPKMLKAFNRAN
jgi:transposase InsO family protein